jgi:hypothetical protein
VPEEISASQPAVQAPAPSGEAKAPGHASPPGPQKKKKAEGVLIKKPGQWVCLVKDEKGRNCEGKLKRFYDLDEGLIRQFGRTAEIYRCMECHTLYRPENPAHAPDARWAAV